MTIHNHYEVDKQTVINMGDGIQDWMNVEDTTSGSGGISTERTMGGRASMNGGDVEGGSVKLELGSVTPSPAGRSDAFGIRFIYSMGGNTRVSQDARVQLGLVRWGDDGTYIRHQPNHEYSGNVGIVIARDSSTTSVQKDTREKRHTNILTSELIWDDTIDTVYHRFQDCFAQKISDSTVIPSAQEDYKPTIIVQDQEGVAGEYKYLYLYGVEMTYYSNPNPTN